MCEQDKTLPKFHKIKKGLIKSLEKKVSKLRGCLKW